MSTALTVVVIALVVIAIACIIVLMLALQKPVTFRVERKATIKAPADRIFEQINDLKAWEDWSPWEKKDPEMKHRYSASSVGSGAVCEWEGNRQVGTGRMEIAQSVRPKKVTISLLFLKPFRSRSTAELELEPEGDATVVTWRMHGPAILASRIMSVFVDMDEMIGRDFEDGLKNLRREVER